MVHADQVLGAAALIQAKLTAQVLLLDGQTLKMRGGIDSAAICLSGDLAGRAEGMGILNELQHRNARSNVEDAIRCLDALPTGNQEEAGLEEFPSGHGDGSRR